MVHAYRLLGKNIAIDVNGGAVHALDDVAYDVLRAVIDAREGRPDGAGGEVGLPEGPVAEALSAKHGKACVAEALEEIRGLTADGDLFTEGTFWGGAPGAGVGSSLKALCLNVSHDCDLRCGYCFASAGRFGGGRARMAPKVAMDAVGFLIRKSGGRRSLEVDFFGGEPTLAFDAVKAAVAHGEAEAGKAGKEIRFTITTNAVGLDDGMMGFINGHMDNVVLSLDGRKEVHDACRVMADGSGSYDAAVRGAKAMVGMRGGKGYYVRGTYTNRNLDFAADVAHLADLGFERVSVEPVASSWDGGLELGEAHLPAVLLEYERLALAVWERRRRGERLEFFHFEVDLEGGPCAAKRMAGCGAGYEYMAVTPDGGLYPCHQFVGMEGYRIGGIYGEQDAGLMDAFKSTNLSTKADCAGCWARFHCGGGCASSSLRYGGGIGGTYALGCEMERKRVECAVWLKVMESGGEG
ncbi:MAG: thioether cross-link-forming SCIFF peptide maturase [Oscillospiraceae bacterium]|nr:thioether cross-link-forming SCIFF peptide maturase [Oscillospiraceae bacterium]